MFPSRLAARKVRPHKARLELELLEARQVMSAAQLWQIGSGVYDLSQTFALHSNPNSTHKIYLDFDGYTTGNVTGTSWDNLTSPAWDYSGNGTSFTTTEQQIIQRVWARVAEDYAPFDIDVTTQDPGFEALRKTSASDNAYGIRVVITPNDAPAPGSGGVAYIGSFDFSDGTPVYVFNSAEKGIAEAASHEVGHSLGLNHDGTAALGYYSGQGSGVTSWGPIMGASYNVNVTQFSKGEYNGANNKEDDLAIITSQNGLTYVSDDYANSQAGAFALLSQGSSQISAVYGKIERNTDSDWFSFWSDGGAVSINVDPANLGPNLAIEADLYNSAGQLLQVVNTPGALNAALNFTLPGSGQYFLKVVGAGKGDPATTGFSNYASLGNYRITGTLQAYTGGGGGGGGTVNNPPLANNDSASTTAGVPVTVNVLANDSDPDGDPLTITSVDNVQGGTAVISNGAVIFTPTAGFSGTGSFTYSISDGQGGTASATASISVAAPPNTRSFTSNTDVTIPNNKTSIITSSIRLSGFTGTIQDVNIGVNIYHTYDSDLQITLIGPNGQRIVLFNRNGGSGDNLLGAMFDDQASTSISSGAAPFTGSFKPIQALSALNGKSLNGTWKLEIRDNYRLDGGKLDNWTLYFTTSAAAKTSKTSANDAVFSDLGSFGSAINSVFSSPQIANSPSVQDQLTSLLSKIPDKQIAGLIGSLLGGDHHGQDAGPEMEADLPLASLSGNLA